MDNVLFVPSDSSSDWVRETLPLASPLELPVAGRRYIDYAIECARKFGILFAEILDWDFSDALLAEFNDLTRTGLAIFYLKGEGERPKGLGGLGEIASPLTQPINDNLVVVWGLCLMNHDPETITLEPVTDADIAETPPGIYKRIDGKWMRIIPRGVVVRNVKSWHMTNFAVLGHPDRYTLPGYSAEKGVYLGRNVVMEHGTSATAPLLMQDDSWCARNVTLAGDVIIGKGAFVSEGAMLKRTVVCDDTFVGQGLELVGKIVAGHRIIDAETGVWTDVEEPGIARRIGAIGGIFGALWRFLQGASRGRRN
jgi:hypothetical protein